MLDADLKAFGLNRGANLADLHAAWRTESAKAHPDKGGSVQAFTSLQAAYKRCLAYLSQDQECPDCKGAGKVPVRDIASFSTRMLTCRRCNGEGKIKK